MPTLIAMRNISKRFENVLALDGAGIEIEDGRIHCIVGENGAGKTTLMRVLTGLEQPDAGEMVIKGEAFKSITPELAIHRGISMVHQHFMLVPSMTVAQNVVLHDPPRRGLFYDRQRAEAIVRELAGRLGIRIDPEAKIEDCSIGEKQQVEILKALYAAETDCLILDEPTSVLTPQGSEQLLATMRALARSGIAIVFITHKLKEVKEIADTITVMRRGRTVASMEAAALPIQEVAFLMTGRNLGSLQVKSGTVDGARLLSLDAVSYYDGQQVKRLDAVSFSLRQGEILGIAGVQGNGQKELAEVIVGMSVPSAGRITLQGTDITETDIARRREMGIAYIPEDRINVGVCYNGTIEETAIINFRDKPPIGRGLLIDRKESLEFVQRILRRFDVRAPGPTALTRHLSGGNIQKLLVGREVSSHPKILIAFQPTWGLDIGATHYLHQTLIDLKEAGLGIVLISMDLDEVLKLSDRILVMYKGGIAGEYAAKEADESRIGLLMAGLDG